MPLSDMYRTMLEATNPATWETNRQKQLMGEYELESKRRSMDAEQRLRELYSSGGPVSTQNVMAISPELGIKLQQAGNQAYLQQLQAEDLMRKQQEYQSKTYAQYLGPLADTYFDDMRSGMKPEMALQKFRSAVGSSQKELEEKHGIRPQADFTQFSPEQILDRTTGLGVPSRHYTRKEEIAKRQMPPQMSSEQYYGAQHVTPEGYTVRTPGMGGQAPAMPRQSAPQLSTGQEDVTEQQLQAYIATLPEGPDKQRLMSVISQGKSMAPGATSAVEVTPEELQNIRRFNETEKVKATESAKADVQRTEEGKRITESFKRAMGEGGVSRVMKMISESTSGKGEEIAAKARGAIPGVGASPGMENIGALNTIAGELRKTIERSPGAQSDKDVALAALDAAAISDPSIPYNQRMKGFLEFTRIIKERAKDLGIDPKELGIDVDTSTGSNMPTAKTDEEAERLVKTLKPGDSFIGPDGKTHKIKGL